MDLQKKLLSNIENLLLHDKEKGNNQESLSSASHRVKTQNKDENNISYNELTVEPGLKGK